MKKLKSFKLLILFFILSSCGETQCDCVLPKIIYKSYRVTITPKENFRVDKDTIWINGFVSSKVYDEAIKDSIFSETNSKDIFSIYKFVSPIGDYNCVDAIDKFVLIDRSNGIAFFESCKNGTIIKNSVLSADGLFFEYRLGLIPKISGDYTISFQGSTILNSNKNSTIVEKYPIKEFPNKIGFNSCGKYSWRILKDSEREFYFNVKND